MWKNYFKVDFEKGKNLTLPIAAKNTTHKECSDLEAFASA